MTIKSKIVSGIATGAMLAGVLLPTGAFASGITISGNGASSYNKANVNNSSQSSVKQINKTAVVNLVVVAQNTGLNKANKNTGGDVTVGSGNATSSVKNTTTTGGNVAVVDPCGCTNPAVDVTISGNGASSYNKVKLDNSSSSNVTQVNKTLVVNGVLVIQNTGGNQANMNTGGSVDVSSGDANSKVFNTTTTGGNVLAPSI